MSVLPLPNRSDRFLQPVRPVPPTGQTGLHGNHARTPVRPVRPVQQKQRAAHLALKCATRRLPNLRVSLHDLPPLCIPADELDTTGAEVDVLGSRNNLGSNKP